MKTHLSSTKIKLHFSLINRQTMDQLGRRNKPIYQLMMNSSKLVNKEYTSITSRQPRVQSLVTPKLLYTVDHLLPSSQSIQSQSADSETHPKLLVVLTFLAQRDSPRSTRKKAPFMNVLHFVFSARTVQQPLAKRRTT